MFSQWFKIVFCCCCFKSNTKFWYLTNPKTAFGLVHKTPEIPTPSKKNSFFAFHYLRFSPFPLYSQSQKSSFSLTHKRERREEANPQSNLNSNWTRNFVLLWTVQRDEKALLKVQPREREKEEKRDWTTTAQRKEREREIKKRVRDRNWTTQRKGASSSFFNAPWNGE